MSNPANTPRTDAFEQLVKGPNAWSPFDFGAVPADFSRELEREVAELQKKIEIVRAALADKKSGRLTNASCLWVINEFVNGPFPPTEADIEWAKKSIPRP
jgi:hypothetical protein